jgi:phosphatidate cytidylyltransferase
MCRLPVRAMTNLRLRVISAVVMAAVALLLTWLGGLPFRALAAAVAIAVFYEWVLISGLGRVRWAAFGYFVLLAIVVLMMLSGAPALTVIVALLPVFLCALVVGSFASQGTWGAFGMIYAAMPALAVATIRGSDNAGLIAVIFLYAVVWGTDIFAYFIGRAIGGPKLAPRISPGKTWSGAIGGTLCGLAAGTAVVVIAGIGAGFMFAVAALVLSIASQIGDLFESWIKRRFGAKDSSNIIPGHGGVMDRIDGLVAAAIALYVIGWLASGAENPAIGLFGH